MKEPSFQRTIVFSALIHASFFVLSLVTFRNSSHFISPSPYVVSLVSKDVGSRQNKVVRSVPTSKKAVVKNKESAPIRNVSPEKSKTKGEDINKDFSRVEDRIAELKAKKRIERIVRLRSVISLKGNDDTLEDVSPEGIVESLGQKDANSGSPSELASYYQLIRNEIWEEWVYPNLGDNKLETEINVKILRDGSIEIQGIEKSSGNTIFDRSALKALAKASPVTPPPFEVEIGIRFYP